VSPYLALALMGLVTLAQVSLVPAASLGDTKPFLPLLVVVSWGLLRGPLAGFAWALALGAMLDLASPTTFGTYTVVMLCVALVVAICHGRVFPANLLSPGIVAAIATVTCLVVQLAPLAIGGRLVVWDQNAWLSLAAKSVALSLLWLPLVYFPLRALAGRVAGPRIDWER
jgi:rod shape-determining protein MreD